MEELNKNLVIAAENGNLEEVTSLLGKGADPNAMGPNSGAIHCASFNGHYAIAKLLLEKGADPNVKDHQSFFPLHLAASKGHKEICELLILNKAAIDALTDKEGTPLHIASASNYIEIVKLLLKNGADIEAKDIFGNTPLITAASLGNKKIVEYLLKQKADINARNKNNNTPLIEALYTVYGSRIDHWESIGENSGVEVKYEIRKGCFRYIKPYIQDSKELGRILTLKEEREIIGFDWEPPNQHTTYLDTVDIVLLLLKNKADFSLKNDLGQTAMSIACHTGVPSIIKALHKEGATLVNIERNGISTLHKIFSSGRLDGLQTYFKLADPKDIDINQTDEYGWTAAHYLADIGGIDEIATILKNQGIDLNKKTTKVRGGDFYEGMLACQIAAYWGDNNAINLAV